VQGALIQGSIQHDWVEAEGVAVDHAAQAGVPMTMIRI
jgi:hypothetical protein